MTVTREFVSQCARKTHVDDRSFYRRVFKGLQSSRRFRKRSNREANLKQCFSDEHANDFFVFNDDHCRLDTSAHIHTYSGGD